MNYFKLVIQVLVYSFTLRVSKLQSVRYRTFSFSNPKLKNLKVYKNYKALSSWYIGFSYKGFILIAFMGVTNELKT